MDLLSCNNTAPTFLFSPVSSDEMSVRAGQGSDEVLVSQAVWDYLAAAGRPWLIDFQHRQGMSAGIIRRGERGGCCAVRLQPVEGFRNAGVMDAPVSSDTRKAFIDLCRCARKEMCKQDGGSKRKRGMLPCGVEQNGEGNLLQPPPLQPRRSQRQQQRFRKPADEEAFAMLHEAAQRKDLGSSLASQTEAEDGNTCSICMGDIVEKTTLEKCGHSFCHFCLDQAFKVKKACPVCRLVYGQLIGNQPANGSMIVERDPDLELPGHEGYGCICIIYSFPPGLQSVSRTRAQYKHPKYILTFINKFKELCFAFNYHKLLILMVTHATVTNTTPIIRCDGISRIFKMAQRIARLTSGKSPGPQPMLTAIVECPRCYRMISDNWTVAVGWQHKAEGWLEGGRLKSNDFWGA